MNKLMEDVQERPEQNMIETLAIRTMGKSRLLNRERGALWIGF